MSEEAVLHKAARVGFPDLRLAALILFLNKKIHPGGGHSEFLVFPEAFLLVTKIITNARPGMAAAEYIFRPLTTIKYQCTINKTNILQLATKQKVSLASNSHLRSRIIQDADVRANVLHNFHNCGAVYH